MRLAKGLPVVHVVVSVGVLDWLDLSTRGRHQGKRFMSDVRSVAIDEQLVQQ